MVKAYLRYTFVNAVWTAASSSSNIVFDQESKY